MSPLLLFIQVIIIPLICSSIIVNGQLYDATTQKIETWTGRWLPERPSTTPTPPPDIHDMLHEVKMGVSSSTCDDARTNLTVDWDFSPTNYTCYRRFKITPDENVKPLLEEENIPRHYVAQHRCMDQNITYNRVVPTFGTHRPLWPRYGEYQFVPRQRWLHTLEHGGIVALYHPCANPLEVHRLRQIVKHCLWRHVITPFNLLDDKRPLALLAWGRRLTMSVAYPDVIQDFIKKFALHGPEIVSRDGQYELGLMSPAEVVTTPDDDVLCP